MEILIPLNPLTSSFVDSFSAGRIAWISQLNMKVGVNTQKYYSKVIAIVYVPPGWIAFFDPY
jgi:hypothetical protein